MRHFRRHGQLRLCALVICLLLEASPTQGQSDTVAPADKCPGKKTVGTNLCLRDTSFEVAQEVCSKEWSLDRDAGKPRCAYDLIVKLGNIEPGARCNARATEALILRQEITEMILTASLQVDGFLSEIDSETAEIRAVHDELTDRRDTAVQHATFGSAVGTAGGAVSSTLTLVGNTATTVGNYVGAASGAIGTVFGFWGYFKQQHGPKGCFPDERVDPTTEKDTCKKLDEKNQLQFPFDGKKHDCTVDGCSPTMLYQLVFPDPKYFGYHSEYDLPIENYLGLKQPSGWRTTLIQPWIKEAREEAQKEKKPTPADPNDASILGTEWPYLFTSNTDSRKLSIDNLTDRANKLADLRVVVARMNRNLGRLTEDLARELHCPDPDPPNTH